MVREHFNKCSRPWTYVALKMGRCMVVYIWIKKKGTYACKELRILAAAAAHGGLALFVFKQGWVVVACMCPAIAHTLKQQLPSLLDGPS